MVRSTSTAIETRYGEESAYAVEATAMAIWRGVTDDSMQRQPEYAESDERTPDLQSPARSLTYVSGGGTVNTEESAGSNDTFKQHVMNSAGWSTATPATMGANTVAAELLAGVNKLTLAGTADNWDDVMPGLTIGSWIYGSGHANAYLNGMFQVVNGPTGKVITVMGTTSFVTPADTGIQATWSVSTASTVSTGVANNSLTIERKYSDIASTFSRSLGSIVVGMEKTIAAKGKVPVSITMQSKDEISATAQIATPTAAPTKAFYSVNQHFKGMTTTPSARTKTRIVSASWKIEHPDFPFDDAGEQGPIEFGKARFVISGTADIYFEGAGAGSTYQTFENGTRIPISFFFDDGAGSLDVDEFPNVILTAGSRNKRAGDVGTMVSYTWVADRHETFLIMARFARIRA